MVSHDITMAREQPGQRNALGVTLLEIMLVLAIAALIIVMSVRYFQSASISQQAVAFVTQAEAIAAAQNSLSQGTANYVNGSSLISLLGPGGLTQPWGGMLVVIGSSPSTPGVFTIRTSNMSTGVCNLVQRQLGASIWAGSGVWTSSNWQIGANPTQPNCWQIYYTVYTQKNPK